MKADFKELNQFKSSAKLKEAIRQAAFENRKTPSELMRSIIEKDRKVKKFMLTNN